VVSWENRQIELCINEGSPPPPHFLGLGVEHSSNRRPQGRGPSLINRRTGLVKKSPAARESARLSVLVLHVLLDSCALGVGVKECSLSETRPVASMRMCSRIESTYCRSHSKLQRPHDPAVTIHCAILIGAFLQVQGGSW
jgi:hypothetical protein